MDIKTAGTTISVQSMPRPARRQPARHQSAVRATAIGCCAYGEVQKPVTLGCTAPSSSTVVKYGKINKD
jgi:hypothetical protein